jgi:signal transduction histidine kinase
VLSVSDTGVGIPLEDQDRIFEKLFRASNAKKIDPDGAGFGLYIIKEILDHSNGKVRFESEEGRGTTFFVTLPVSGMIQKAGERRLI